MSCSASNNGKERRYTKVIYFLRLFFLSYHRCVRYWPRGEHVFEVGIFEMSQYDLWLTPRVGGAYCLVRSVFSALYNINHNTYINHTLKVTSLLLRFIYGAISPRKCCHSVNIKSKQSQVLIYIVCRWHLFKFQKARFWQCILNLWYPIQLLYKYK